MSYSCQPHPCAREAYYYKVENNTTTCAKNKIDSKGNCTQCSDPINYELKRIDGKMMCVCKKGENGEVRIPDTTSNEGGVGVCKIQCPSGPTSPYALTEDGKCRLKPAEMERRDKTRFLPQINTGKPSEGNGSQPMCDASNHYYYSTGTSECVLCEDKPVSAMKNPPRQCCNAGFRQDPKTTRGNTTYKNSCPTPAQGYNWREGYDC